MATNTPKPEPTTLTARIRRSIEAAKALELLPTDKPAAIRIALPELEALLDEAEAAAARAEGVPYGAVDDLTKRLKAAEAEREVLLAALAEALRPVPGKPYVETVEEARRILANLPAAAQEWEQRIRADERTRNGTEWLGTVDWLAKIEAAKREAVNDWLASPDAERRLAVALHQADGSGFRALLDASAYGSASREVADRLRSQAASQPVEASDGH